MEIVFFIIGILILCVVCFYVAVHIVKLWTGCDSREAVKKIQDTINGKSACVMENDPELIFEIWNNLRLVIGEARFNELCNIANTTIETPLIFIGTNSNLPYLIVSVFVANNNEKIVIENLVVNIMRKYLKIYGRNSNLLLPIWKERYDVKMPFLEVRYARNSEEEKILKIGIQNEHQLKSGVYNPVTDDTEVSLNE